MFKDVRFLAAIVLLMMAIALVVFWPDSNKGSRQPKLSSEAAPGTPPLSAGPAIAASGNLDSSRATSQNHSSSPVTAAKEQSLDDMAAKVNGEPITWEEVQAGIGKGFFGPLMEKARQGRRELLIAVAIFRQYIKTHNIAVDESEVDRTLDELKKNPPAMGGCMCCAYNTLEAFLAANLMTMKDLRDGVRNDLGLHAYADALWDADYPVGEKRDSFIKAERPRIERDYVKMSHIFFNTAQQPDFEANPDGVRQRARNKATTAMWNLQSDSDFAKVAQSCSEDTISRSKGGSLGCVLKTTFGKDVEDVLQKLKPGERSQPIESPWGFHLVRRDLMTEQDVLDVLRKEYRKKKLGELYSTIEKNAKIERF